MSAKAVDYSKYTHEMLFKELDDTSKKLFKELDDTSEIERLTDKWAQIELEIINRHTPNDETIKAMKKCELISSNDEIIKVGEVSKYLKGLINNE